MTNVYTLLNITDKLSLQFGTDAVGRFFLCLVSVMWVLVGIYAQKYKEHQKHNARFFVFYALTWVMLAALTMAANYLTMYLCFEFMTLLSMPLVLHNGTPESIAAAKKYLFYSIFGATLGLLGMFFVNSYGTTLAFATGGVLDPAKIAGHEPLILWVAFLSVAGFGAKAGLFPLHAWLPTAHPVAPAPASALLSGCITKAGVLCILRLVYQIFGVQLLRGTWVQTALIILALVTVFMGSMMAYGEDLMKKRFAFSTVSQVSYVLLGVFTMNEAGLLGALLHAAYHSIIKDGLFLCAGTIISQNARHVRLPDHLLAGPRRHSAVRRLPEQMVSGERFPVVGPACAELAGARGAAAVRAADGRLSVPDLHPRLLPGGRRAGSGRQRGFRPDARTHPRPRRGDGASGRLCFPFEKRAAAGGAEPVIELV